MIKQVIVLRTKYPDGKGGTMGMRSGKLVAQGAHASMKVFLDKKTVEGSTLSIPLWPEAVEWINGIFTKICVGVETKEELVAVHEKALAAGLPTAIIEDVGLTEFRGIPTLTALAIGPAEAAEIDKITGQLKLL